MRDRLITAVIGIVTGCSVVLFGTWLTKKDDITRDFTSEIKSLKETKLDKIDFNEYRQEHNQIHVKEETKDLHKTD